jgi:hypothetical protein
VKQGTFIVLAAIGYLKEAKKTTRKSSAFE